MYVMLLYQVISLDLMELYSEIEELQHVQRLVSMKILLLLVSFLLPIVATVHFALRVFSIIYTLCLRVVCFRTE